MNSGACSVSTVEAPRVSRGAKDAENCDTEGVDAVEEEWGMPGLLSSADYGVHGEALHTPPAGSEPPKHSPGRKSI